MTVCTLDPGRLPSDIALSNGNLTWTGTDGTGSTSCFGTLGYLAGAGGVNASWAKYFEGTLVTLPGGSTYGPGIGIATASMADTAFLGQSGAQNGGGFYLKNGFFLLNGNHTETYFTESQGAITGVAVSASLQKIWLTDNGTTWNNDIIANQNPATGTGGVPLLNQVFDISGTYQTIFPAFSNGDASGSVMTANFGATAFAYPLPAGYLPWGLSPTQGMFLLAG